ncbi:hypothetical protein [Gluconobacter kondonii]|uniref:hypothetical protein n=1 Tax=Gluconobacter kondonii TaxID=941463 RepID=UPI001981E829|nr:hypothetical protein [Gluconobacter kondonii]MBN3866446.1 hypothetical protein [Gluconobacter kondonii]
MTARATAPASPFAHLNRMRAENDDDKNNTPAEGNDDGDGGDDEPDGDDDTARKGKKTKRGADDDGGDDDGGDDDMDAEDEEDEEKASARARERGRCAAIFSSPLAARNPAAAAEIAFNTNLTRSAALRMLSTVAAATPDASRGGRPRAGVALRERMAGSPPPRIGADGQGGETRPGARLVAASRRNRGAN